MKRPVYMAKSEGRLVILGGVAITFAVAVFEIEVFVSVFEGDHPLLWK